MNKYIITVSLLIFNVTLFGQINNGRVIYKKQFSKKIFTKKNTKEHTFKKFSNIEKKMTESQNKIKYSLRFTKDASIYEIIKSLKIKNDLSYELSADNSVYYTSKKESIKQTEVMGDVFLVSKKKTQWKLINETKKIGKFNCLKATTSIEKKINGKIKKLIKIAWYTPEINVPFGPIGYHGLPGLIIELIDGNYKYKAIKIELNTHKNRSISPPTKGKKISEIEMNALVSKMWGEIKNNRRF